MTAVRKQPITGDLAGEQGAEKPLFVPLASKWFLAFESGEKDTEYRAYGPRWNEDTCRIGRRVTLSYGYSGRRLRGRVAAFERLPRKRAPSIACKIFPNAAEIAAIKIEPE